MDYKSILDEIKPTEEEKWKVLEVSAKLLDFLNDKLNSAMTPKEKKDINREKGKGDKSEWKEGIS